MIGHFSLLFFVVFFQFFLSNDQYPYFNQTVVKGTQSPESEIAAKFDFQLLSQNAQISKLNNRPANHSSFELAKKLYDDKEYKEALRLLREISTPIKGRESIALFKIYELIGQIHTELNQLDSAIAYFKEAILIANSSPEKIETHQIISVHEILAKRYRWMSDYLEALQHHNQILALIEKESTTNFIEEKINAHCGVGKCYRYLFKKETALKHFNIALNFVSELPKTKRAKYLIQINEGLGLTFNYFDDYQDAIIHFKSSISYVIQEYGYHSKKASTLIDMLGNSYYYLEDYHNAIQRFEETIKILTKVSDFQDPTFFSIRYSKVGACYTNLQLFDKADYYLNKSVEKFDFDINRKHPFENITSHPTNLLITLYFKAKNHQKAFEAGRGRERLYEAARWFDLCIELIEHINSTFEESGSKKYLLDRFYYIFEAAINSNYHLYQETDSLRYLEQAFGYAERSKALLLKEAMQRAGAEAGIPNSLMEEERRLSRAVIERENRRYELQQTQENQPDIHELNSEIFNLKQEYQRLMDSIRQQYPKAHRFRYATELLTPGQIQSELLAPGQALVQYFLGEEHIFLFIINQEEVALVKRPVEEGLARAVGAFRESIYGWSRSQEDSLSRQYADYGYQLYQSLVQPIAHLLPEHLIIIPDGILEYIPFEALLREAADPAERPFASFPYLIRDYQVSYAHSARLLQEMTSASYHAPRRWILAFAPYFQDPPDMDNSLAARRRNLGRLTGNVREVQAIKSLLRTRIYKGNDATRERFLADAPHYSYLHLATHAKANDEEGEYSYLAFAEVPDTVQNELLYAKDLYSMRLQADMVVLSACESGIGELRRGEGVISLARGFSYAGAKSLATTLWRVSDRESATLMELFYQGLSEGMPKDGALRAAKLQYISQADGMKAHPFFWAAFILSGDMAPIEVSARTFPAWGYALLIGLFVFLALRFAKRKPN